MELVDNDNNETVNVDIIDFINGNKLEKKNLWIPTDYNNIIEKTSGSTNINCSGYLEFVIKFQDSKFNKLTSNFIDNTKKIKIKLDSKNKTEYLLNSDNNDLIEYENNIFNVSTTQNKTTLKIKIEKQDTIFWSIDVDSKINFNLIFVPDSLNIIKNLIDDKKALVNMNKKDITKLNSIVKNLNTQITSVLIKSNNLKYENEDLLKNNNILSKKEKSNLKVIKHLQMALEREKENQSYYEREIKLMNNNKKNDRSLISKYKIDNNNKKIEINELREANKVIKTSIEKYRDENKLIVQKNKLLLSKITVKDAMISDLKDRRPSEDFENLEMELEDIQFELWQKDKSIEELNKKFKKEKEDLLLEIDNLKKEKEELFKKNDKLCYDYNNLDEDYVTLLDHKDDISEQLSNTETELELIKKEKKELIELNNELKTNNSRFCNENQNLLNKISSKENEIGQLNKTNKYLHNEFKDYYQKDNKKLKKLNENLKIDIKELNNKITNILNNTYKLKKDNKELQTSKENIEFDVIDLKLKNTELELKVENLEKKKFNKESLDKCNEIFKWYVDSIPVENKQYNNILNYTKSLESEIITVIKEFL